LDRPQDAGEHGVRVGPAFGSVSAADLARDDGGAQRVLGPPVGRIDRIGFEKESKHRWEFDGEMRRETTRDVRPAGPIDERVQLILQMPTSNGHPVRGDTAVLIVVANTERVLEDPLDLGREAAFPMILDEDATAPQQMRETRLMNRLREAAIRRPAVAHEDAGEIGAEQRRGFRKPAPGLNRIDRRVRRRGRPQPLQPRVHFPAGFIRRDHGTAPDGLAERVIGRCSAMRGAADRVDQAASGDRQTESFPEQRGDFAQRQPELFIQHEGQRDRGRPELRRRRADRIGRLQRVAPLHAATALGAVADGDVECTHDGADVRHIFLVLRRVARGSQSSAAIRTTWWQRRRMSFMDRRWDRPMRLLSVGGASPAARPAWPPPWRAAGERRGLSVQRTTRIIQLVFETIDLLAEAVTFLAISITLAPQTLLFSLLPFEFGNQLVTRGRAPERLHALVMP